MNVIGFSGALDGCELPPVAPGLSHLFFHDAAAALVKDGILKFAVEEERLNRQKHSNAFPAKSLYACLQYGQLQPDEIDVFAFFFEEAFFNRSLLEACATLQEPAPDADVRSMLCERLSTHLNFNCDSARIEFVNHHLAHARSAFSASGFDESLVLVLDGNGERDSASIYHAEGGQIRRLANHSSRHSLGHFYRKATSLVGFKDFDEYKFMGLAPYGDPSIFRTAVQELIHLDPDGKYTTNMAGLVDLVKREDLSQSAVKGTRERAANLAAAIQVALERAVLHIISPYAEKFGHTKLCLAGGVAQNCVMNTQIANSGLFEKVFAYPGAYDAGAAIGAALEVSKHSEKDLKRGNNFDPFLGPSTPDPQDIENAFKPWRSFLDWHKSDDASAIAAHALAAGKIVGWVNGRSEFGPRALGARSILADARPFENWSRINLAIKQRESFRPFAPACLQQYASKYFDMPDNAENLGHMTFISNVRDQHRALLGAVTHVDGSARLQTVSSTWNSRFTEVLENFHALTGCPVVLNTSFNNSAEPIVQTPEDAVRTFLITGLDTLVIDDWVVTKHASPFDRLSEMEVCLSDWSEVIEPQIGKNESWVIRRAPHYAVQIPVCLNDFMESIARGRWLSLTPFLAEADSNPENANQIFVELWRASMLNFRHVF